MYVHACVGAYSIPCCYYSILFTCHTIASKLYRDTSHANILDEFDCDLTPTSATRSRSTYHCTVRYTNISDKCDCELALTSVTFTIRSRSTCHSTLLDIPLFHSNISDKCDRELALTSVTFTTRSRSTSLLRLDQAKTYNSDGGYNVVVTTLIKNIKILNLVLV